MAADADDQGFNFDQYEAYKEKDRVEEEEAEGLAGKSSFVKSSNKVGPVTAVIFKGFMFCVIFSRVVYEIMQIQFCLTYFGHKNELVMYLRV